MSRIDHIFIVLAALFPVATNAQNLPTENVTTVSTELSDYIDATTFADMSQLPECGIIDNGDGVYVMTKSLEIPAETTLSIDGLKTLMMGDGVTLDIHGNAYFDATYNSAQQEYRVKVTRVDVNSRPGGIRMYSNAEEQTTFRNIDFEFIQLANMGSTGFDVIDCTFTHASNILNNTAAVMVSGDDAVFNIVGCTFTECEVPAIGCPANNAACLTIRECTFIDNNTSNTNKPQLNLTVGGENDLIISDCMLTGTGRNMVGGIAIGNLLALPGSNRAYIEGCTITGHRYGITGVGPMYMEIRNNTLIDNCHEDNAMNGGSGISLAGYGYGLDAIISGNYIEGSFWGVTLIQCRDINMGEVGNPASPGGNTFKDNGNGGNAYDLYNNQTSDVYAQLNTWSVDQQTQEKIEEVIFHNFDNSALGLVTYMPASAGAHISNPTTDAGIKVQNDIITSRSQITLYRADGLQLYRGARIIDISNLEPGFYIATDGISSVKIKK